MVIPFDAQNSPKLKCVFFQRQCPARPLFQRRSLKCNNNGLIAAARTTATPRPTLPVHCRRAYGIVSWCWHIPGTGVRGTHPTTYGIYLTPAPSQAANCSSPS